MPRQKKLPPGMRLRGDVYHAQFRHNGKMICKSLGGDFETAKLLLADLRSRSYREEAGLLDNNYPLAELEKRWFRWLKQTKRPGTVTRYGQNMANIRAGIPVRTVGQVTPDLVYQHRSRRLMDDSDPSVRTVNMEVGALSTMFTWGVTNKLIGSNPIASVEPLANDTPKKQRRSLTAEEVERIWEHSPPHLTNVWRMFATSGIREDELANMVFEDVDHDRQTVVVHSGTAKNHKSREIPLDETMLATIRQLEGEAPDRKPVKGRTRPGKLSTRHVFVTGADTPWLVNGNLLRAFYAVCERAGIEGAHRNGTVDIHALRGTFATLALENGARPKDVQEILGHSTLEMTMKIYAKSTDRGKRQAVDALPFATTEAPAHIVSMEGDGRRVAKVIGDSRQIKKALQNK